MNVGHKPLPWTVLYYFPEFEPDDDGTGSPSFLEELFGLEPEVKPSTSDTCELSGLWVAGLALAACGDLSGARETFRASVRWAQNTSASQYATSLNYLFVTELLLKNFVEAELVLLKCKAVVDARGGSSFTCGIVKQNALLWIASEGAFGSVPDLEELESAKQELNGRGVTLLGARLDAVTAQVLEKSGEFGSAARRYVCAAALADSLGEISEGFVYLVRAAESFVHAADPESAKAIYDEVISRLDQTQDRILRDSALSAADALGVVPSAEELVSIRKGTLDDLAF